MTWWIPRLLAAVVAATMVCAPAAADEVRVAVAANFTAAAKEIAAGFEAATGHRALLSFGSTGQLYTQIAHGAPFEVFLAADRARPELAEAEGLAVTGTRTTYATGRIVLFSRDPDRAVGPEALADDGFEHLAIANPETAPYGAAAVEVLRALAQYERVADRLVQGKNIAQTYQFVATGNAELGFVALSQLAGSGDGAHWLVPADLHAPIAQDAVLLEVGKDSAAAAAFLAYLMGPEAAAVKKKFGYGVVK